MKRNSCAMLKIRKTWINYQLWATESPAFAKVCNIGFAFSTLFLVGSIYTAFDGTRYIDISGVKVPVECKGFCLDKD